MQLNDEQTSDLFRVLASIEKRLANLEAAGLPPKTAGSKPGSLALRGVQVLALNKEWPNDAGWFRLKVGAEGGAAEWFSTKTENVAAFAAHAREAGMVVDVTYNETKNGEYVNRYLCTIAEEGCGPAPGERSAALATPRTPPAQKKAQRPAQTVSSTPADNEDSPF